MKGFKISKTENGGVAILSIKGHLDTDTAPDLEIAFQELVDARKYSIVINFKDLNYIGSAGFGVLMRFIEDIRKNGGDIKLTNMKPKIYRVFDLLGFPSLYDILDDETKAVERFKKHYMSGVEWRNNQNHWLKAVPINRSGENDEIHVADLL